jgi:hypothetical protein
MAPLYGTAQLTKWLIMEVNNKENYPLSLNVSDQNHHIKFKESLATCNKKELQNILAAFRKKKTEMGHQNPPAPVIYRTIYSGKKKKMFQFVCHKCQKPGHRRAQCPFKKVSTRRSQP